MFKRREHIESPSVDYRRSRETTGQKRIRAHLRSTKNVLNSRYSRQRIWRTASYGMHSIVTDSVESRKTSDVDANDCDRVQYSIDVK